MNNENIKEMIGNVLGGVTEDGSEYNSRVREMDSKGVTDKVINKLKENDELQTVLDMVETYQNDDDNITGEEREILYERTDEVVYSALRELYPYVEEITNSFDGWSYGVFSQYLKTLWFWGLTNLTLYGKIYIIKRRGKQNDRNSLCSKY